MKILFITSQWPSDANPNLAPFVKNEVDAIRARGAEIDLFVFRGGWSLANYIRAIRELRRTLRSSSYDVLHARFGQSAIVARSQWGIPVVVTYGGSDVEGSPQFTGNTRYQNYILRLVSWVLALLVDEVIVVADHLGRKLPRKSYHVIPSGVDLALFHPSDQSKARQELGLPMDKKLVLFAGDPRNKRKRIELAEEASRLAAKTIPHELVVISDEPREKVPVFMNACDALILTSTNEGSPNVVKEALACNLPVVSVDVGDVRERIGKIFGCEICKDDSPGTIAESLLKVLQNQKTPSLRNFVHDLDNTNYAMKTLEVYGVVQNR